MVILVNVMFFSNKFMGMDIGSKDLVAKGIIQTIIFFSIVLLIYINGKFIYEITLRYILSLHIKDKFKEVFIINKPYKANKQCKINKTNKQCKINKTNKKYGQNKRNQSDESKKQIIYIKRLKHIKNRKLFGKDIKYIRGQVSRMLKKVKVLNEIITSRFQQGDITYNRLSDNIKEIEGIFYFNIIQIVHKLEAFDEKEFLHTDNNIDQKLEKQRSRVYLAYKDGIEQGILDNDQILIKLDELIIEFSRLVSKDNNLTNKGVSRAMNKIDELIQISRYYK